MLRPEQPTIASSERRIELVEPDLAQNMFSRLYSATKIDVHPNAEGKFTWSWKMLQTGSMTVINGHAVVGSADVAGAIPYYLLSLVQQGTVDFKSLKYQTVVTADKGAAMVSTLRKLRAIWPRSAVIAASPVGPCGRYWPRNPRPRHR